MQVEVLAISGTRPLETVESGEHLARVLTEGGHQVLSRVVFKDDAAQIRACLLERMGTVQVIISSGGTGIAGRDVTIPVVESLITKPMPGFGELFRMLSYPQVGAAAMLSRAVGGLAGNTLIFALPGSLNAVETAWKGLLESELPHLVYEVFRQTGNIGVPANT
ncbi:MAG: MogA/MoaB family molybdenum cofactor biosynthesis protein [Pseudopedobacter sp.]|nr:MogA/MoaB family molybdenum cofactor biosynthesis protein [Deinococcales bacterium]